MSRLDLEETLDRLVPSLLADGHAELIDFLDLLAGDLKDNAAHEVRNHAAQCERCAGLLREAQELHATIHQTEEGNLSSKALLGDLPPPLRRAAEKDELWKEIAHRIDRHIEDQGADETLRAAAPAPTSGHGSSAPGWNRYASMLLAALLALALGLGFWVVDLKRQLGQPRANLQVVELQPLGNDLRRAPTEPAALPPGIEEIILILIVPELDDFPRHHLEIRADGRLFWEEHELTRAPEGGFTLALPLTRLPAGPLDLELWGVGVGATERRSLAQYQASFHRTE